MNNFEDFFGGELNAHKIVDAASEYPTNPEGTFNGMIDDFTFVQSDKNQSQSLHCSYVIVGGEHDGFVAKDIMWFVSKEGKPNDMARTQYAELCIACGSDQIVSYEKLRGKRIRFETKRSKDGKYVNVATRMPPSNTTTPQAAAQATAAPAAGANKMPWAK